MQNENNRPEMPKEKAKNPVACMGYCPHLFFVPFIVKNECDEDENRTAALQGFWLLLVFIAIAIISSILILTTKTEHRTPKTFQNNMPIPTGVMVRGKKRPSPTSSRISAVW